MHIVPLLFVSLLPACNKDKEDTAVAWAPDLHCPGDTSGVCDDAEGVLRAGAGKTDITPSCFESWEDANGDAEFKVSDGDVFLDCGCDRICPEDDGWTAADTGEGDGEFQAVWIAGFQNGRPAASSHDPLWARAAVIEQGATRVGIVAVDLVGWFFDDVERTRVQLKEEGIEIDWLVVSSTHTHEGPDTVGLWGQRVGRTGYDPAYAAEVRDGTVTALKEAVANLEDVGTFKVGWVDSREASEKGTRNLVRDSRDPQVVDERVNAAWLANKSGETLVTLLNWGNHPEVLADENTALTADYAHYLREAVENGVTWDGGTTEGLGGTAVYLNGTVGGLMTPLGVTVTDGNGVEHSSSNWAKSEALGKVVGEMMLTAIEDGETLENPALSFKVQRVQLPVDNIGFQAMFLSGVLDRELYDYDPAEVLSDTNVPKIYTEVGHIAIGSLELLTVPGELFPEVAFGGYDGSKVGNDTEAFISPDNPNPPQVEDAPSGPYWAELMETEHAWIVGLANDELGYIIPAYDFKVHETVPYLDEAEGDHYEETNSLGPQTEPLLDAAIRQLMAWEG